MTRRDRVPDRGRIPVGPKTAPATGRRRLASAVAAAVGVALLAAAACGDAPRSSGTVPGGGERADGDAPGGPVNGRTDPARGARIEQRTITSRTLGRRLPYLVFLPPGYAAEPERRYPALYMLHGLGGDYREWTEYGLFEEAERLILAGEIPPMVIVLPQGDGSYWMDHAGGGPRWGAYVARDVVAEVDGRYRTRADRAGRAVGGNSMGAHGALQLALNFPDVFGTAGAHSPTLRGRDTLPPYFGDQRHFEAHDPVTLARRRTDVARAINLWLDISDSDAFAEIVDGFHRELDELGIPHWFSVRLGPHDDEYWAANTADYLRFYGDALR